MLLNIFILFVHDGVYLFTNCFTRVVKSGVTWDKKSMYEVPDKMGTWGIKNYYGLGISEDDP